MSPGAELSESSWDPSLLCYFPGKRPRLYTQEFPVSVTISSCTDSGWAARGTDKACFLSLLTNGDLGESLHTHRVACGCEVSPVPGRREKAFLGFIVTIPAGAAVRQPFVIMAEYLTQTQKRGRAHFAS